MMETSQLNWQAKSKKKGGGLDLVTKEKGKKGMHGGVERQYEKGQNSVGPHGKEAQIMGSVKPIQKGRNNDGVANGNNVKNLNGSRTNVVVGGSLKEVGFSIVRLVGNEVSPGSIISAGAALTGGGRGIEIREKLAENNNLPSSSLSKQISTEGGELTLETNGVKPSDQGDIPLLERLAWIEAVPDVE